MKQIGFTPAGCSFWHKNVLGGNDKFFAYCSTTTIYIYNAENFKCEKIINFPDNNIMILLWPKTYWNKMIILSSSKKFYLCDTTTEEFSMLIEFENQPVIADWGSQNENLLAIGLITSFVRIFDINKKKFEKTIDLDFTSAKCLKWNKNRSNILACGCNDGTLLICDIKGKNQKNNFERKDPILCLDWDNHSHNYLLLGHKNGEILLVDTEKMILLQYFEKNNSGISSLLWIKGIPGGFLSASDKLSTIKIWSVSAKNSTATMKISSLQIFNIHPLNDSTNGSFLFLISFADKSIGIYDVNLKKVLFQTEPNHSETIFDAQLNMKNPNILATSSYDGSIKIWNLLNMKCLNTLEVAHDKTENANINAVKDAIIYGISWSPLDENRLVAATYGGKILLCDTQNSKIIKEIKPGSNKPIHRIEWNRDFPEYIATGSKEGFVFIFNYKSKDNLDLFRKFKIGSETFGISWKEKMLAIGSKDGLLRIYEIINGEFNIKHTLKGHSSRIFNVAWNPMYSYILASGSDDKTIRIWNLKKNTSYSLEGHTNFVRPICWHNEIPWILISGGWDANLKVWNTLTSVCIHTSIDHHSDIYAINSHPLKPNLFITGSRDNSIRLWNFKNLLDEIQLSCYILKKWENYFKENLPDYESLDSKEMMFYGTEGKNILKMYQEITPNLNLQFYEKVSKFFSFNKGEEEFWNIIYSVIGIEKNNKGKYNKLLINEIEEIYQQKIKEMEGISNKFFYDSKNKEKDRLNDLANIYLKVGKFEKFCEIQSKVGNWEKALCFAPAVSYEYWQSLIEKYAKVCEETDFEESSFLNIISNHSLQAIRNFIKVGNLEDAKLLATLLYNKKLENVERKIFKNDQNLVEKDITLSINEKLKNLIHSHSEKLLNAGNPFFASLVHLSIKDGYSAIIKLIRANCLYEAYILAITMKMDNLINYLIGIFIEKLGKYNLLYQGFKDFKKAFPHFNLLANYYIPNKDSLESFNKIFELPSQESLKKQIFNVEKDSIKYFEINLMISSIDDTFNMIYDFLINTFSKNDENILISFNLLEKIKYGKLLLYKDEKKKKVILAFANFLAMKKAIWKGYFNMVVRFFKQLKNILKNSEIKSLFPINFKAIKLEYLNFIMLSKPNTFEKLFIKFKKNQANYEESNILEKKKNFLESLDKQKFNQIKLNLSRNKIYLDDINLPFNVSRTTQIKSLFTGENIKCSFYCLEDMKSYLEMEEALMWSNCNPFSPLNTGYRIDPY